MRFALLLALLACAPLHAAVEVFTLADGRLFAGEYDDESGELHTLINSKPTVLRIAKDQITEREVWKPKRMTAAAGHGKAPAIADGAPTIKTPEAMTPEEKAAADRAYATALKVREAERLEAEAGKARRDAESADRDAAKQMDQAKRNWAKFQARAREENMFLGEMSDQVIVLPRTAGNSQATADALVLSRQSKARADDLRKVAAAKMAEAAEIRRQAAPQPAAPSDTDPQAQPVVDRYQRR